jgi:cell division transport system permease protein
MLEGAIAASVGAGLAVLALWLAVKYLVADWLGESVGWIPYVGTADVATIAPVLVAVAILLALTSSLVTLNRFTKV